MKIVIVLMVMCSTTPGTQCQLITTPQIQFKDIYECTVYGYNYSEQVILEFGPEFVNTYGAYTKFSCEKKEVI